MPGRSGVSTARFSEHEVFSFSGRQLEIQSREKAQHQGREDHGLVALGAQR